MPSLIRFALVCCLAAALEARAVQLGSPDELLSVEMHGFVSQGFIYSTHQNNYLARSKRGSFEFTEVGLNFTKPLVDRLRLGVQLFSRDLGPIGNYAIRADWFYLDYRFQDWLGFRAGRVKLPFGLYNDSSDIDAARVPILLPQSLYPIASRDFLLAQTGAELYGYLRLGSGGALDYRAYGGTIFIQPTIPAGAPYELDDLTVPYVAGGRLFWETPVDGLKIGASAQALRLDLRLLAEAPLPPGILTTNLDAILWVTSVEYSAHDVVVAAEYSRWHTTVASSNPVLFPDARAVSERAYALVSYRVRPWLTPSLYYSLTYPDVRVRTGRENQQHDLAVTLRFDINPFWLVKLEGHYMNGTAGLASGLNDGRPLSSLAREWGVFLVKTTGYF